MASILFLVLAAQFLSSEELGTFVLGLSTAIVVQSLVRALSGETLLVRSTTSTYDAAERHMSLGLSLVVASALAVIGVVLSLIFPNSAPFFLSLGSAQLGLLLQDGVRYAAIASGQTIGLLTVDLTYTVVSCSSIWFAGQAELGSGGMLSLLGCAGSCVAITAMFAFRLPPRPLSGLRWLAKHWRLNSSFVTEAILGALLGYSITLILNFFVSGPELAAYRSALSIFGMTSLAINFLRTVVLRDLRIGQLRRWRSYWWKMLAMTVLIAVTVGGTYGLLRVIPPDLGMAAFGETWGIMVALFSAVALNRFFAGLSIVPTIFLRVQGVIWRATVLRVLVTAVGFGFGPLGAFWAGAKGALLAEAALYLILAASLLVLSRRSLKRPLHRRSGRSVYSKGSKRNLGARHVA
ncbi:hypothetical protein OCL88_01735 [Paenarthrobacter sp. PAE-2]|uniref:hypothetical protein n=1 Tax=Paenarthrobacter sp. PAE-2 TaxID=2982532 RepID=UPI002230B5BE|nr:hypothetical protein [Paenarthrobacter sp. PAE-2]MCW3765181.1 hypothetical protein [Paenarthrobacter sp. PAE-2]